jgi:hypothetical protein
MSTFEGSTFVGMGFPGMAIIFLTPIWVGGIILLYPTWLVLAPSDRWSEGAFAFRGWWRHERAVLAEILQRRQPRPSG